MPKGILFVESRPSDPSREDEYNQWYTDTHIPDVCAVPGFVGARRYTVRDTGRCTADPSAPTYVAIYQVDSDDLAEPMNELATRRGRPGAHERRHPDGSTAGRHPLRTRRVRATGVTTSTHDGTAGYGAG